MTEQPLRRSPVRLDALPGPYDLDVAQVERLEAFATQLASDPRAPTTVRSPRAVANDHIADALVALDLPELGSDLSSPVLADLGTGAGVPGIPLAIALPMAQVFLVEASERKCEFLRDAVGRLRLDNAEVVWGRAETWTEGVGRCDVVTARALAPLDVVEEYAAPLLRVGGSLVVWRGRRDAEAEAAAARAAAILGLEPRAPAAVTPYRGADHRHLHVITKLSETPERFPRRDGVARKRPLGNP